MAQTAEDVIQGIVVAFERRGLADSAPLFRADSSEVDASRLERVAQEMKWIDIPSDVLCDNPLALAFMTPAAFAWFLPAYLIVSIALYSETDTLTTTLITCLTPPDDADQEQYDLLVEDMRSLDVDVDEAAPSSFGADDELLQLFIERANELTGQERAAVRNYLQYIEATHGADFPAFGPKQALDRYWATAAPLADGSP